MHPIPEPQQSERTGVQTTENKDQGITKAIFAVPGLVFEDEFPQWT